MNSNTIVDAGTKRSSEVGQPALGRNRLSLEKSPYLLQHADNPVDWYGWGEDAFEKAAREDKPVLLSVGYSTCHWCHVMAHETFEDAEAAGLINENFVPVKVDREERPDIDHLYMTVCQMMTGRGGWPMTVFLTPDKRPFFAATYIPRESRNGTMGMKELSIRVGELWRTKRNELTQSADKIATALRQVPDSFPGAMPDQATLSKAYDHFVDQFDRAFGGFGDAPKFPTPHNLLFLLRYWKRTGEAEALAMVEKTLRAMRSGGIYDHVGFGFHRYSTDSEWLLPHFEKMLYDQALLTMVYTEAYLATGRPEYERTAREIIAYVLKDMTDPHGAFYSAEDADSEGEEGKYYVWTYNEMRDALGETLADFASGIFNVRPSGNFRDEATGEYQGTNVLHASRPFELTAVRLGMTEPAFMDLLEQARLKLLDVREKRIRPHLDDKVLADWNGLMIAALAKAAQAFEEPEYSDAAQRAAGFVLTRMRDQRGRLLHRYREGEAAIPAHADDYAFFIWGLLELYEATFDVKYLRFAVELNGDFARHFLDGRSGGFNFSADDSESLLLRRKEIYDGATPSANSVQMLNLIRLARLTGDSKYEDAAGELIKAFSGSLLSYPAGFTQALIAVEFIVGPSCEVVVTGKPDAEDASLMLRKLRRTYVPNKVVLFKPHGPVASDVVSMAPYAARLGTPDGTATAYVCRSFGCELPTTDPDKMLELLDANKP
ncbi:MAG: thioredoxin domain-containing protein [Pseudomonadota bacterium]